MSDIAHAATFLFVPGDRPKRFAKAATSGADVIVLDLEDAVAPYAKDAARQAVMAYLASGSPAVVRCNAADTAWFAYDIAALSANTPQGLMLPKAADPATLAELSARLPDTALMPLIETAAGFAAMASVAAAPSVSRLVFGTIDFQADLGIDGDRDELLAFRSEFVLRSRLVGINPPVDGVSLVVDDPETLAVESKRARKLGFSGKLCIHPRQVETVAAAFRPAREEIDRARRILAAAEATTSGVVLVDGRMVDRPVVEIARGTLQRAAVTGKGATAD